MVSGVVASNCNASGVTGMFDLLTSVSVFELKEAQTHQWGQGGPNYGGPEGSHMQMKNLQIKNVAAN